MGFNLAFKGLKATLPHFVGNMEGRSFPRAFEKRKIFLYLGKFL